MKNAVLISVALLLVVCFGASAGPSSQWNTYYSAKGKFAVDLPGDPVPTTRSLLNREMQEYKVEGYVLQLPDREWVILYRKDAPTSASDIEVGAYTDRFNADILAEWPSAYALEARRRVQLDGKWSGKQLFVTSRDGYSTEMRTYVIDGMLYHLQVGHHSSASESAIASDRARFFGSFRPGIDGIPSDASKI